MERMESNMCDVCGNNDHPTHSIISQASIDEIKEMMAKNQMAVTDAKAAIKDMLKRLDREDLETIASMISAVKDDELTAGVFLGAIKGALMFRFDTDFDGYTFDERMQADAMQGIDTGGKLSSEQMYNLIMPDKEGERDEPPWQFPNQDTNEQLEIPPTREDGYEIEYLSPEEIEEAQKKYHLVPSEDSPGRWVCTKCTLEYISVADRKLRDDCHGCQTRASQG